MKILLQHIRTQLYLRNLGSWTPHPREAFDFRHSQSAIDFTREHDLRGVQIVVKLKSREGEEIFPLPARAAPPYTQDTTPNAAALIQIENNQRLDLRARRKAGSIASAILTNPKSVGCVPSTVARDTVM